MCHDIRLCCILLSWERVIPWWKTKIIGGQFQGISPWRDHKFQAAPAEDAFGPHYANIPWAAWTRPSPETGSSTGISTGQIIEKSWRPKWWKNSSIFLKQKTSCWFHLISMSILWGPALEFPPWFHSGPDDGELGCRHWPFHHADHGVVLPGAGPGWFSAIFSCGKMSISKKVRLDSSKNSFFEDYHPPKWQKLRCGWTFFHIFSARTGADLLSNGTWRALACVKSPD